MAGPDLNPQIKTWLVKSSTRILGPFTRDEVMTLLSRRQVTIIDEIRQPDGRWNYIRENHHFKEIVKGLRYEDDHSREDTMTSTATVGTVTFTKTESPVVPDEFTPTPVTPSKSPPDRSNSSLRDVTPKVVSDSVNSKNIPSTIKTYGNVNDQRVQAKIQQQNVLLRTILFAIVFVVVVFAGYSFFRKEKRFDMNYEQLISASLRYKEMGLYQKSLENYKKAAALREPDLESQFQMIFLLINEDRQSLNGRRIIERSLFKEGRTRSEIIDGHLGMALSYMMEGDLRQAEDYIQKTLGFDANNEAAKINQAVILLKKGNYSQALNSFESLTKGDALGYPLILLGKTISLIELSKSGPNKERLVAGINEIKSYLGRSHFLYKELSMLLIYLNHLNQDPAGELDAIMAFMDEPYYATKLYSKNLTLDWRNSDWDFLERYCSDLYNLNKGSGRMKAVRAMCLIESNRDMEASKFIDEAIAQEPKQVTSVQAQASYLTKLGRTKEAHILYQNSEFKQTRLALYTKADACLLTKDYSCAEEAYRMLLQLDYGDVIAHSGLAKISLDNNDRVKAQAEIKAGFESEANFVPLIEIREKLESL